jgi:hypothetical protein
MAKYVFVENNEIKERHDSLPTNWRNISGFRFLQSDPTTLLSLGWYPVVRADAPHDPNTSYISEYTYTIGDDVVIETPVILDYTEDDITEKTTKKRTDFFNALRNQRNELLRNTDWTQLADVQSILPLNVRNALVLYRNRLRNLPQDYADTTDYDISTVVWPNAPEIVE